MQKKKHHLNTTLILENSWSITALFRIYLICELKVHKEAAARFQPTFRAPSSRYQLIPDFHTHSYFLYLQALAATKCVFHRSDSANQGTSFVGCDGINQATFADMIQIDTASILSRRRNLPLWANGEFRIQLGRRFCHCEDGRVSVKRRKRKCHRPRCSTLK